MNEAHNIGSKNAQEKDMAKFLRQLTSLIKDDKSIQLKDDNATREILKRFLRARKFNVQRALKSVKKYVTMKRTNANILEDEDCRPEGFKFLYAKRSSTVMANRDANGRQIIWLKSSSWDPTECTLTHWLISVYLMLEEMVLSEETQRNGIIMICDFDGLNLLHLRHVTLKPIELLIEVLQETLPVSFKEIHAVNHSVLFKIVWSMAKPFIKEKLRKRIQFHGHDMNKLHQFISPSILSSELGGHLSWENAADTDFLNNFLHKNSLYVT